MAVTLYLWFTNEKTRYEMRVKSPTLDNDIAWILIMVISRGQLSPCELVFGLSWAQAQIIWWSLVSKQGLKKPSFLVFYTGVSKGTQLIGPEVANQPRADHVSRAPMKIFVQWFYQQHMGYMCHYPVESSPCCEFCQLYCSFWIQRFLSFVWFLGAYYWFLLLHSRFSCFNFQGVLFFVECNRYF
jgi:hypothetical protein